MTTGPPLDLMGAAEIGKHLGVSRQRVQQLVATKEARKKHGFPEPAAVLEMGKVWHAKDIRDWAAKRSTA